MRNPPTRSSQRRWRVLQALAFMLLPPPKLRPPKIPGLSQSGLLAFVFRAAVDYTLSGYPFTPGPYPTSRSLIAMLPWQLPIHLHLYFSSTNLGAIVLLPWRMPGFAGHPTAFHVQALAPLVFTRAA